MSLSLGELCFLVVDDNDYVRRLLRRVFVSFGVGKVVEAEDGEAGYEIFRSGAFDIVFADWMMGPVDGLTLVRNIRNRSDSPDACVPIIMVTAYTEQQRVEQARDAGVNEILAKPFTINGIVSRLEAVIERPRPFVRVEGYFGPDRRRRINLEHDGPERRASKTGGGLEKSQDEALKSVSARVGAMSRR